MKYHQKYGKQGVSIIYYLRQETLHTTKARLRSGLEDAYSPLLTKWIFHWPPTTGELHLNPLLPRSTFQINRIQPEIEKILRQNPNGFRKNRSAACQILTVQRIIDGVRTKILKQVSFSLTSLELWLCASRKNGRNSNVIQNSRENNRNHYGVI